MELRAGWELRVRMVGDKSAGSRFCWFGEVFLFHGLGRNPLHLGKRSSLFRVRRKIQDHGWHGHGPTENLESGCHGFDDQQGWYRYTYFLHVLTFGGHVPVFRAKTALIGSLVFT